MEIVDGMELGNAEEWALGMGLVSFVSKLTENKEQSNIKLEAYWKQLQTFANWTVGKIQGEEARAYIQQKIVSFFKDTG